tara:strand:+ start:2462 stop:2704 length:243 start_codon:yes stop_codon:yes gene_type:complete
MKRNEWIEVGKFLSFMQRNKQGPHELLKELIKIVNVGFFPSEVTEVRVDYNDDEPTIKIVRSTGEVTQNNTSNQFDNSSL